MVNVIRETSSWETSSYESLYYVFLVYTKKKGYVLISNDDMISRPRKYIKQYEIASDSDYKNIQTEIINISTDDNFKRTYQMYYYSIHCNIVINPY